MILSRLGVREGRFAVQTLDRTEDPKHLSVWDICRERKKLLGLEPYTPLH